MRVAKRRGAQKIPLASLIHSLDRYYTNARKKINATEGKEEKIQKGKEVQEEETQKTQETLVIIFIIFQRERQ